MGKKPDENESRHSIKKMIHSEMMDRGLVVDKKKKTRSSRDRSRPVSSFFISRITQYTIGVRIISYDSTRTVDRWAISIGLFAVILLKCFM